MEIKTLRSMTTELSGRTVNSVLEEHLPQYALEMEGLLSAVRTAAQTFPADLEPAAKFSLKQKRL